MRTLLDFLRENRALGEHFRLLFRDLLREATVKLEILDPERGEEELVKSVAAELAQLHRVTVVKPTVLPTVGRRAPRT